MTRRFIYWIFGETRTYPCIHVPANLLLRCAFSFFVFVFILLYFSDVLFFHWAPTRSPHSTRNIIALSTRKKKKESPTLILSPQSFRYY